MRTSLNQHARQDTGCVKNGSGGRLRYGREAPARIATRIIEKLKAKGFVRRLSLHDIERAFPLESDRRQSQQSGPSPSEAALVGGNSATDMEELARKASACCDFDLILNGLGVDRHDGGKRDTVLKTWPKFEKRYGAKSQEAKRFLELLASKLGCSEWKRYPAKKVARALFENAKQKDEALLKKVTRRLKLLYHGH